MASRETSAGKFPQTFPTELIEIPVWVPEAMQPGYLFLLPPEAELGPRQGSDSFCAVLSCPQCGTLGLITEGQYLGQDSVLCGSGLCSCHFFIHDHSFIEYLPVQ